MRKKLLILCLSIFLITGCSASYNLDINDKINENIIINVPKSLSETKKSEIENYVYKINPFVDNYFVTEKYNIKKSSDDINDIYNLSYQFKENYVDSVFTSQCFEHFNFVNNDDYYIFNASGHFGCLYDNEEFNINIKTDKYVSSNNANKIKNNVYTWNINKKNRNNIDLKMIIMKNVKNKTTSFLTIFNNLFKTLMVFILISGALYLYVQMEKNKK